MLRKILVAQNVKKLIFYSLRNNIYTCIIKDKTLHFPPLYAHDEVNQKYK